MLRAARECGSPKNHLPALQLAFDDWCWGAVENFQLEKALNEILKRERRYTEEMTGNYGEWRRQPKAYRNLYEFEDDPQKPDDELLTLRLEWWPEWGRNAHNLKRTPGNVKRFLNARPATIQ
jgi:hypothetical protein